MHVCNNHLEQEKRSQNCMHEQVPEGVPYFIHINQNVSSGRKALKQNDDDIAICECKYDARYPDSACGERCLNVLTSTECVPGYCPCGEYCKNQRFQKCQYAQTKLFRTEGRGWGLLAGECIKAGDFVIEYCGEIISSEEAKQRSQAYEAQGLRDAYIISLNANYFIDATKKGSVARFINHSCQPNCETRKWTVFGETRVGIFAKQDIAVGTELAYDYNFEWYGGANVRCLCGAPNCSIFLGAKSHGFQEHNHVWEDGDDRYTVDMFPLYDSAEDEPFTKHFDSASLANTMYTACGNKDNPMKVDGFAETNHFIELTNIISEPFGSAAVEGPLPINAVKSEVKKETDLFPEKTQQDISQPRLSYNSGSGSTPKSRSQHVPKSRSKQASRKQVNGKNVAKLFASKQAQEEVIRCEELRTEATKKLNDLYDEIRPSIEEHAKDSQDNVPTAVAEKWIEATCTKWKAELDLHFSIIKNVVCPRPHANEQTTSAEGDHLVKQLIM
ncbi:hypothetical protein DCAR_0101196 [Daucus carota subsp. sativus]|uniref:Histone-lysine N-methyltransferase ASHH1 n=1 Tax=Daucus carota subsp. sativus TaxID=79200 RepID=A0AAF1AIU5_DAUCS|nr:hypothetical protein DCAR_0101196 [Daucus carota subsp. sativus]